MSIYVITSEEKEHFGRYKVGRTASTKSGILSAYTRHLGKPILKYYKTVQQGHDYKSLEADILQDLQMFRTKTHTGRYSEWVQIGLSSLIIIIENAFEILYQGDSIEDSTDEDSTDEDSTITTQNQEPFVCDSCNKSFIREDHLTRHRNRKNPCNKQFKCARCLKVFKRSEGYNRHIGRTYKCKPTADVSDDMAKLKIIDKQLDLKLKKEETKQQELQIARTKLDIKLAKTKKTTIINISTPN